MRRERLTAVEPGDVGEMAARSEHASDLAKGGRTIGHELHHERADGHVHGRRGQGHRLGARDHDPGVVGAIGAQVYCSQGQHLGSGIESDDLGVWPASCRRAAEGAGAGTDVEDRGAGAVRGQPGRGDIEDAERRGTDHRRPVALVSAGVAVVAGDDGGHPVIVPCPIERARSDRRRGEPPTAGV